jgi:hypothetical protein
MLEIKQVGNRYYCFSRMQVRSFPIKKSEALAKIEKGEAYLVEKFITDPDYFEEVKKIEVAEPIQIIEPNQPKTNSNKIINFADRFQAKQEKESLENAMSHFLNEVLPNLKLDEMKKMMESASNSDNFNAELMRATLRI